MSAAQPELLIDCEGAGCPTHDTGDVYGMCAMCGIYVIVNRDGNAISHQRRDLIAMIERGDFG